MDIQYPYDPWEQILYISSAETAQQFLLKKYDRQSLSHAHLKSFDNSYPFIYHIDQGTHFFRQSERAPLAIKPLLLFYGLVFLLKAAVLVTDPNYPETSSVLAHGASTRKRKKQNYRYFEDEIKIQKHGLFPHFSKKMFHMEQLEGKKTNVRDLLNQIPEVASFLPNGKGILLKKERGNCYVGEEVLDTFHMTTRRFFEYVKSKTAETEIRLDGNTLYFSVKDNKPSEVLPFRYNMKDRHYYFLKDGGGLFFFRELMIHYLLLYHLSMLARYEIEWWSELLYQKPTAEYPVIHHYLSISEKKCPLLIGQFLFND